MQIETKFSGMKEIDEDKIIEFNEGILGFPKIKKYVLFPYDGTPFLFLQSVEQADVCFVLLDPAMVKEDYIPAVLDEVGKRFKDEEPVVYTLMSVEEATSTVRINLQAPIVIQVKNRKAEQVVLTKGDYPVAYALKGRG